MKITIVFIVQQIILQLTTNYTPQTMPRHQSNYTFDDIPNLMSSTNRSSATNLHLKAKVMYKM